MGEEGIRQTVETVEVKAGSSVKDERIRRAIDYIRANLSEKLTVQELAEQAGMSTKNLQRVFKQETGQTVKEYVHDLRMKQARELLVEPNRRLVTDVALEVGYDLSNFIKAFKRLTGTTPGAYRKNSGSD